jgi:hypothetical protein
MPLLPMSTPPLTPPIEYLASLYLVTSIWKLVTPPMNPLTPLSAFSLRSLRLSGSIAFVLHFQRRALLFPLCYGTNGTAAVTSEPTAALSGNSRASRLQFVSFQRLLGGFSPASAAENMHIAYGTTRLAHAIFCSIIATISRRFLERANSSGV